MKTFKIGTLILGMMLWLSIAIQAQNKEAHKAMRQEMQTYTIEQVIPVLKEQRLKLEKELSSAEKLKLAQVRQELKTQKESHAPFRGELKELKKSGGEMSEAQKAQLKKIRDEKRVLMEEVRVIARNHEEVISGLNEEIKDQKLQWKADMEAIRSKYISDEEMLEMRNKKIDQMIERLEELKEEELGSEKVKHFKRKLAKGNKSGKQHAVKRLMKPVGFLLMDPTKEFQFPEKQRGDFNASVYPNPASYKSQIDFELPKNSFVKIELLDRQGNVLQTILEEDKKKGKHVIPVDTSKLPTNIYYYKITTKQGSETKRFLKQ